MRPVTAITTSWIAILQCTWLAGLLSTALVSGQTYSPPSVSREIISLDAGWRFIRQDVPGAQTNGFDDSSWTPLSLPHTWNNLDGQDGGNNYYRGIGWYRLHYTVSTNEAGRRLFLKFDGANIVSDVYVNGILVGEHQGGFAAFVLDVTPYMNVGDDNVIAVKVNNASNSSVPPLSADFTFFGGIYRDVYLLTTDPLQVSPQDYGSPGVYLQTTGVSSNSAALQITTVVSNAYAVSHTVAVRAVIADAATNIVKALTNTVTIAAGGSSNVIATTTISNPHLWDGLNDPYLYQVFIELHDGTNITDWISQPLGFRYFRVDPNNGFFLNGHYYDLHGVSMHQDWLNYGWALTNGQRDVNFAFLKDLGVTALRMAHYQNNEYNYELADRNGIVVWSEIPLVNSTTETPAFYNNAKQQLHELIRQNYNHPCVVCWGMYNEQTLNVNDSPTNLVNQLVQLEAQEDPTRPSTAATLASNGDPNTWYPQLAGFNEYFGWYENPLNGLASWADSIHAAHPTNCIGISEFGAGASIYQHSENPVAMPGTTGAPFHPEEWQNIVHETNWAIMKARPFLWCKFVWNMFDFAVDSRNEGDTPGRNDKGLSTYDRLVHKDAYYFYKANWTTNAMVYITGHTFTNRLTNSITAKAYANCDTVELFLNGTSQGTQASTNDVFTWPIVLASGSNYVEAIGSKGGLQVTDSLSWFAPLGVSITNPTAAVVFLNSTNDTLQLSGSTGGAPLLQITWSQSTGPGVVTFGSSNALSTTARFSAEGVYGVALTVSNGSVASAGLTVIVNPNFSVTNGLSAWWKMDESGGTTAFDSSGNGRNASLTSASFTSGYISNALQCNGTTSRATYTAQDTNQITVAAWVRCDGQGNSQFPRIVDLPDVRMFFRFGSSDVNSLGFSTFDSVNGDWDSGGGTINSGTWFHVAASYDRSNSTNVPALYVNGVNYPTVTLTPPSGTPPPFTGTGYIGNRSTLDRGWDGLIDDLRIYNHLLSAAEIQALAAMPPANLAPVVSGGTNQVAVVGTATTLNGTAADDGKPNPPGALTTTWSQVNGPGMASFGNANKTNTTVTFDTAGTYVLQLSANDGQITDVANVTINVLTAFQSWQSQYFDCTNCPQADAAADPDGDGMDNLAEFLAGTDPTNSASAFRIISVSPISDDVKITWQTTGGRTNVVQAAGDTGDGYTTNFLDISPLIVLPGTGGVLTNYSDAGGMTNTAGRYYRIRLAQ